MKSLLEDIIANGNRFFHYPPTHNVIRCRDGFEMSVIAGALTYSTPRGEYRLPLMEEAATPFSRVEVGFPTQRPEPWDEWQSYQDGEGPPTHSVYGYVPVDMVRRLVASHGGEYSRELVLVPEHLRSRNLGRYRLMLRDYRLMLRVRVIQLSIEQVGTALMEGFRQFGEAVVRASRALSRLLPVVAVEQQRSMTVMHTAYRRKTKNRNRRRR
jgi:hypothetical protein